MIMAKVNMTVEPKVTNGQILWEVCLKQGHVPADVCGNGTPNDPYPYVVLKANNANYNFEIDIIQQPEQNIAFASTNPITIKGAAPGSTSPFTNIQVANGTGPAAKANTKLTFVAPNDKPNGQNPDPVVLDYQLNFAGSPATPSIDPIIINGGSISAPASGGSFVPAPGSTDSFYLMGYVFVAALIATIVGAMIMRRR